MTGHAKKINIKQKRKERVSESFGPTLPRDADERGASPFVCDGRNLPACLRDRKAAQPFTL